MCDYTMSQSGWIMKEAHHSGIGKTLFSVGPSVFKRRFMVICTEGIFYYDDHCSLETPRHSFMIGEVSSVSQTLKDNHRGLVIHPVDSNDHPWNIQWIDGTDDSEIISWVRKFDRFTRIRKQTELLTANNGNCCKTISRQRNDSHNNSSFFGNWSKS